MIVASNADPFNQIRRTVRVWADRLDDIRPLESALREAGASIPIVPLRTRPRGMLERVSQAFLKQASRVALPKLVRDVQHLREVLLKRMDQLAETKSPVGNVPRKWHVQGVRFTANRLLQLVPREDRNGIAQKVPSLEELHPLHSAILALAEGDATHVVRFPGPHVATVARLWVATHNEPMQLDLSKVTDQQSRGAAYVLWLFGAVRPNKEWLARVERSGERAFGAFCADLKVEARTSAKFSYIDEIQSLHMTAPEPCWAKMRSRHSTHEDVPDDLWDLFS